MITVLDTHGPPREMGLEALEEEGEDSEKEAEEDGDENMMDGTGKHFFTNGCKNKDMCCAGWPQRSVTGKPSIMADTWLPPE